MLIPHRASFGRIYQDSTTLRSNVTIKANSDLRPLAMNTRKSVTEEEAVENDLRDPTLAMHDQHSLAMHTPKTATGEEAVAEDLKDQTPAVQEEQAKETEEQNERESRGLSIRAEQAEIAEQWNEVNARNEAMARAMGELDNMSQILANQMDNSRTRLLALVREMDEVESQRPATAEETDRWHARIDAENSVINGTTRQIRATVRGLEDVGAQVAAIRKEADELRLRRLALPKK